MFSSELIFFGNILHRSLQIGFMCMRENYSAFILNNCETCAVQCAHGRPTTVPLVNLDALRKQVAKVGFLGDSSSELWHGLCRQKLSIERAAQRLSSARG